MHLLQSATTTGPTWVFTYCKTVFTIKYKTRLLDLLARAYPVHGFRTVKINSLVSLLVIADRLVSAADPSSWRYNNNPNGIFSYQYNVQLPA